MCSAEVLEVLCYFLREKWEDLNNKGIMSLEKNKKSLTKNL